MNAPAPLLPSSPPSAAPPDASPPSSPSDVPPSLDSLIRLHHPRIARLVYRLTAWSRSDAEDLVQEVFLAALRSLPRFDGRSSLSTWLTRIAINTVHAERRKRLVRARFWRHLLRPPPQPPPPSHPTEQDERAARVLAAVRALPAAYREPIILRYLEGMDLPDIAAALRLSKSALDVRLHRARQMLRDDLKDLAHDS